MPTKWQVWAAADGRLIWLAADRRLSHPQPPPPPPPPPPPATQTLAPPPPSTETLAPQPSSTGTLAPAATTSDNHQYMADHLSEGPAAGASDNNQSMADLLIEARRKFAEGDGMAATAAVGRVAVREDEEESDTKKRKQRGDGGGGGDGLEVRDVAMREQQFGDGGIGAAMRENLGDADKDGMFPIFQTGSGKVVSLSKGSIRKARAVLGGNVGDADGGDQFPTFRTGLGKAMSVSEGSIRKARAVFEEEGISKGGNLGDDQPMFETGLGRLVLVSEGSIQKARAVVEEGDITKGGNVGDAVEGDQFPMFQTGSGRSVSMSEVSIRKARAILEGGDISKRGNVGDAEGARLPMFQTGLGRSVSVSKSSINKARAVLEGGCITKRGNVGDVNGSDQFPMFQTGSGRSVLVSEGSIRKARAVLEGNAKSGENVGDVDGSDQFPMFQTGLGRSVSVSEGPIEKARAALDEGNAKNGGHGDVGCQFPMFQTGLGRSVAVSQSSIQKARAVLGEGDVKKSGHGDSSDQFRMFQTGLQRSVSVSESSIRKARAVLEDGDVLMKAKACEDDGQLPLFQTGSGRSVSVSKSSIEKAHAVLEPRNISKELEDEAYSDCGLALPMFQTGLGRSVLVSENSIKKAQAVLDAEETAKSVNDKTGESAAEIPMFQTGSGRSVFINRSSIHNASVILEQGSLAKSVEGYGDGGGGGQLPMFHTGSGRSVLVSESSVQKARAVLEEQDAINRDILHGNMDRKCGLFVSPLKTSSTRTVNISSVGISRAATLLGLEESNLSTQLFGHVGDKLGTKITVEQENLDRRLGDAFDVNPLDGSSVHGICPRNPCPSRDQVLVDSGQPFECSENLASNSGQPPIRFRTAGGRSTSISSDAIQRAKSLLGESDLAVQPNDLAGQSLISACKENKLSDATSAHKRNTTGLLQITARSLKESAKLPHQAIPNGKHISSLGSTVSHAPMLNQMNGNGFHLERKYHLTSEIPKVPKPPSKDFCVTHNAVDTTEKTRRHSVPAGALVDITNYMDAKGNMDHFPSEMRRTGRNSVSPFKRPRSSRFTAPLNSKKPFSTGLSKLPPTQNGFRRTKLSTCYPFQHKRKNFKDFFGGPPCCGTSMEHVSDEVKHMDANKAKKYKFQNTGIGAEGFQKMLHESGASLSYATKEWVTNHYKWIVWKLASLERCYPTEAAGKYLTVPNVFEELKYRYDREVNYGHRSAIKKILEGNASPASMMVLCISAIHSCSDPNNSTVDDRADIHGGSISVTSSVSAKSNLAAKIELTDGWYSLEASLDVALSKQLGTRKLFIGQKLRIWGASLCGWAGPVSFLEASTNVRLMIHINGTYRASWNEPLGFCKSVGPPLAFRCIKSSGGRVPRTLVGVTRIYPLLYKERLPDGGSVVRSERMERKALQLYHRRVSKIAEDILSEQQENCENTDDSEEGAKICKMLERAAEPEVIMADMTSEQLMSFSTYQAKQRVIRQSEMVKKIEKALEDAGLNSRDVTPFMKVRVVGLTSKCSATKSNNKEGLITIWNPTEKQKVDLVEGQIYSVTGLMPLNYFTEILYLQARGSSTIWKPLPSTYATNFEPFFTPRKAILLSSLGEVPLASDFDIAGVILHVGDVYLCSKQKKQWIFLTDGSKFISGQKFEEQHDCLLAVSFCSPTTGDNSAFFSYALSGNIVGFSNLVKRAKDQMKHMWVAEATESSTYSLSCDIPKKSHLKETATSAEKWAFGSYSKIQQLRERVLCIIGDSGG